ncbi:MAG: sigma-70 family RNA polymerase sigma factor [Deltaproteobacteria bacterium]|nr:sigma-70 family RNA polymerase sigma factor [Deltaproteobacteria bacterium]
MKTSAFALTTAEREKLVRDHMTLVRTIAANVQKKFNLPVPLDDLISDGHTGLMEAVNRFNPAETVSFSTFAGYRIRGAMIDALRRTTLLPRGVYRQLREAGTTNAYLQSVADEPATPESRTLEARAGRVEGAIGGIAAIVMLALDGVPEGDMSRASDGGGEDDVKRVDPMMTRRLGKAVMSLRPEEREFLKRVYVDDKIFAEVASEMKRSRSWVTRTHQAIIVKLRNALGTLEDGAI